MNGGKRAFWQEGVGWQEAAYSERAPGAKKGQHLIVLHHDL